MIHTCAREGCDQDSLTVTVGSILVTGTPERWFCSLKCLRGAQGTGPGRRGKAKR